MTATSEETDILESLDFQPPCEVKNWHKVERPPAVLVAVSRDPKPCGCRPKPVREVYMCQGCWDMFTAPGVMTQCGECWELMKFIDIVARVIRL